MPNEVLVIDPNTDPFMGAMVAQGQALLGESFTLPVFEVTKKGDGAHLHCRECGKDADIEDEQGAYQAIVTHMASHFGFEL